MRGLSINRHPTPELGSSAAIVQPDSCEYSIAETDAEFNALREQWDDLFRASSATIFQSYEWLRTWWKHCSDGKSLQCVVFRKHGQIVGIAPLYVEKISIGGVRVANVVRFVGSTLSDYLDLIMLPGHERSVLNSFAEHLHRSRREWDILDLEEVNENSLTLTVLPRYLQRYGMSVYPYRGNVCPQKYLPKTWDLFLQSLGANSRYNLKRKLKKLADGHRVELETFQHPTDDLRAGVEAFFHLHGMRWKSLGYPSAFDEEVHRNFHIELAQEFARRGWLRLHFLTVDGQRTAVSLGFNYRTTMYMYQCNAYGPDEIMRFSPGFIIKCMTIERGIAEGMTVYDFLRGDESYKYEGWNSVSTTNWLLRAVSPSAKARTRFRVFLPIEFTSKVRNRFMREWWEFRRFCRTRKPSTRMKLAYMKSQGRSLLRLAGEYVQRYFLTIVLVWLGGM
jgi:CelD/BcsL family acetyltransferase involved in cellulose biosynthesis